MFSVRALIFASAVAVASAQHGAWSDSELFGLVFGVIMGTIIILILTAATFRYIESNKSEPLITST
jgi:hypothetical protein